MTQSGDDCSAITWPALGLAAARTPVAKTAMSHQARAKRRIFIPDLPRLLSSGTYAGLTRSDLPSCLVGRTLTDARHALLGGLIDHAPTFPPEELPLEQGLAEHRRVRGTEHGWIVNRFVCRASRLSELDEEALRPSVVLDTGALPKADERIEAVEAAGL